MKLIFLENYACYGYRRIHATIKGTSLVIFEKIIRRLMREEQLIAIEKRSKKYCSYRGEISPAVENVVDRQFHAETPHTNWLTDLTDNAAYEGFLGRMKNECFYNRHFKDYSIDSAVPYMDRYIHWHNTKRIKKSLGYLSPMAYRHQLKLAT